MFNDEVNLNLDLSWKNLPWDSPHLTDPNAAARTNGAQPRAEFLMALPVNNSCTCPLLVVRSFILIALLIALLMLVSTHARYSFSSRASAVYVLQT